VLGFKSPHDPRTPPDWAKNLFPNAEARVVPNLTVRPPFLPPLTNGQKRVPKIKLDKSMVNHFRCIAAADAEVGRLLKALDELGLSDNTMIVFVGDNGYYQNEHELWDKRTAYEESLRIPLLVRYPKLKARGAVRDEMVLNIDLPSTLLDYAGVTIPKQMQGLSWRPLLDKAAQKGVMPQESQWRHAFFYEYFFENPYNFAPTTLAVRTETAKLIKYPGHDDWTELFDLQADPYETRNLWSEPANIQLRERILADFDHQAKAVAFKLPTNFSKPKPQ
jgi:arylsulfatase A-like enzyme